MKNRVEKSKLIEFYTAKNLKKDIGIKHNYSLDWRLYGHRITKNLFFRNFKIVSQNKTCPICDIELEGKICLHHIDYDHVCQRGENILLVKNMPNCKSCFNENPDFFISCSLRTVLVHNNCHGKLHNDSKFKCNDVELDENYSFEKVAKKYSIEQIRTEDKKRL